MAALRLAALVAAVAVVAALGLLLVSHDVDTVREAVDSLGAWSRAGLVAVIALLTLAFFPFPVMAAAAGLLFGTLQGTLLATAGGWAGACAAFAIARRAGAAPAAALAGPRTARLLEEVGRRGFGAVLLLRVFPGVPRDLVNYLCGLAPVGFAAYAAATLIGIVPRAFAYVALGGSLDDPFGSPEAVAAVITLVAMGGLGVWLAFRPSGPGRATSSRAARSEARP